MDVWHAQEFIGRLIDGPHIDLRELVMQIVRLPGDVTILLPLPLPLSCPASTRHVCLSRHLQLAKQKGKTQICNRSLYLCICTCVSGNEPLKSTPRLAQILAAYANNAEKG